MRTKTLSIVTGIFMAGALLLTACNLPKPPAASPTSDAVATRVSLLLTSAPTAITVPTTTAQAVPTALPGATAVPPSATETVAASPTVAPSATLPNPGATPSPTLPSGDPKSALGNPTWRDTLDTGKAFYLFENENTRVTLENGALVLSGLSANGWMGWSLTFSHPAQNFYVEAIFNPQACSGADLYGLVFRAPRADAGYFFGVTCDGKYNLHARDFTAGTDTRLIDLTANSAIQPGPDQINRLGVMANGNKIGLYANGILLQEISDSSYSDQGSFGALVAANATAGFTVKMNEIALWKLP